MGQTLQMNHLLFEIKFDILKIKNIYWDLPLNSEIIQDIGQAETEPVSKWKHLYAGLLLQKLIYMHRENM
jgi:hypothetical protein